MEKIENMLEDNKILAKSDLNSLRKIMNDKFSKMSNEIVNKNSQTMTYVMG